MNKAKLGEVCTVITDGSHNPPKGTDKSEYLMLSSKNVYDDIITFDEPRYLSAVEYEQENKRTNIAAGDVLLTIVGTVGRCAVVPENCGYLALQRSVAVLKPKKDICESRYLMYALISKRAFFEAEARGVAQKGIYLKQLSQIEIPVPNHQEQSNIVHLIDKVQSLVSARQQQLTKLDNLIKARFVEMFGDPETNPYGWKKETLGAVCDVRDGTHDSPKYCEMGYPLVTSKNVTGGCIDLTTCNSISEEAYNQINERSKVDWGDIIMPMIGTVGKPVIVNIEPNFAIKNVALIKFPIQSPVCNIYIQALLESDYFDRAVISKVRGGTQKFIALGDIRRLEILIPDTETQNEFAIFVAQVNKSKVVGLIDNAAARASRTDGYQCAA